MGSSSSLVKETDLKSKKGEKVSKSRDFKEKLSKIENVALNRVEKIYADLDEHFNQKLAEFQQAVNNIVEQGKNKLEKRKTEIQNEINSNVNDQAIKDKLKALENDVQEQKIKLETFAQVNAQRQPSLLNETKNEAIVDISSVRPKFKKDPVIEKITNEIKVKNNTDKTFEPKMKSTDNNHRVISSVQSQIRFTKHVLDYSAIEDWKVMIKGLVDNKALFQYALSKKRQQFTTMDELFAFITKSPASSELEKLWVVYLWITHNIDYDFEGYSSHDIKRQDADNIFKTGKSVCAGYSNLFEGLCNAYKIKCINVNGYAKGYSYSPGDKMKEANHAWNAIYINGEYRIIDSTWGAGHCNASEGFVRSFEPHYFLMPPQISIFNRLPELSEHQYLPTPYTIDEFELLPYYRIEFFANELKPLTHKNSIIQADSNSFQMEFDVPSDVKISAHLKKLNGLKTENRVFVQRNYVTKRITVDVSLHSNENIKLSLFAAKTEASSLPWAAEYLIVPTGNIKPNDAFCTVFTVPTDIYLFEPKCKMLNINQEYSFKVCTESLEVVLIEGDKWTYFKKSSTDPTIWSLNYKPIGSKDMSLSLSIKTDNSSRYSTAFRYKIN